jgi:hypothetical protein
VISSIFNLLNNKGIDMPYPTQTVIYNSQAPSPTADGVATAIGRDHDEVKEAATHG